jgi:predicted amidohydrolase YtcJ
MEHVEHPDPADLPRFGSLGVIASMQPSQALAVPSQFDGAMAMAIAGDERDAGGWVLRSIARAGGRLAFGSEWPVATMDPILGLHVAVNRTTPEGLPPGGWHPGERLTLPQALDAFTRDAAWASFDEHRKGSLERDMLADLVILTEDIFALPATRLAECEVAITIFDGRVVYSRATESD